MFIFSNSFSLNMNRNVIIFFNQTEIRLKYDIMNRKNSPVNLDPTRWLVAGVLGWASYQSWFLLIE